jgi:biopolymer transport protein ExbD
LNVLVEDGKVISTDAKVEAITWGDLHSALSASLKSSKASQVMLDAALKPKYQFLHDIMEGVSFNRHMIKHAPLPHLTFIVGFVVSTESKRN